MNASERWQSKRRSLAVTLLLERITGRMLILHRSFTPLSIISIQSRFIARNRNPLGACLRTSFTLARSLNDPTEQETGAWLRQRFLTGAPLRKGQLSLSDLECRAGEAWNGCF